MSDEVHETTLASLLIEFAQTMVTEFSIQEILDRLVQGIAELLPVTGAGVTLVGAGGVPAYLAASNEAALGFERLQTESAQGPCRTSVELDRAVALPDLATDTDYPLFGPAAVAAGLRAAFAFPLRRGADRIGALDLYRDTPGALGEHDMATAQILADVASSYLTNAHARQETMANSEALSRANTELARSNADLEHFAIVAAHDLKQPLTTISGFASLLERGTAPDELLLDGTTCAGKVLKGVQRMQTLVDDLLDYARVGTTALREPVDLGDLLADARALLSADIDRTGAQLDIGEMPVVLGDASQLRHLFLNMIDNAIKFRRTKVDPKIRVSAQRAPKVSVSIQPADDRWTITVEDNGIGIDPTHRDRAFEMFHRLHPSSDYPGTGIGLAICRRVVENHGGTIAIDDSASGGTLMRFDLPGIRQ